VISLLELVGDRDGMDWGRLELVKLKLRADLLHKLMKTNKCSETDF
jgi:hypothetical protein